MALTITASNASRIAEGVWMLHLPSHEVRFFGGTAQSRSGRSVLWLKNCKFDQSQGTLQFAASDVVVLSVGTLAEALAVLENARLSTEGVSPIKAESSAEPLYGPGDREFLDLVRKELPNYMQETSRLLLEGVRKRTAGDLKRGKSKNFSDTPDNFWYVIIQPRKCQLSITVRGTVEHFAPIAKLSIKDDRGNTLFKVSGVQDVPAALELIFHAKRK